MKIILSPWAWYSIAFSVIEVYPNECMGAVLSEKTKKRGTLAITYQLAKRTPDSVETYSTEYLTMFDPRYYTLADFHSHPSKVNERDEPVPSEEDFELSPLNTTDIIVKASRVRKNHKRLLKCERGKIYMHWKRFLLIAGAYKRGEKEYTSIPLEIRR
jgi:proteasome lid subunit RPN8/RPN11